MNRKVKLCFVAQFPPPIHGLSKAVETLYNGLDDTEFIKEKIDITQNKKIAVTIWKILLSKADIFYYTISQTRGGNLRDLVLLNLILHKKRRCVVHLHGGYYRQLIENDIPKWQYKWNLNTLSKVDAGIVLGKSLKHIFEGLIPEKRIFIVPNCVDDEYVMSEDEFNTKIAQIGASEVQHVLYLSNMIRDKGYRYVLQMAKLEKDRIVNGEEKKLHFDFAGAFPNDAEKIYFENYVSENDLSEVVTYHGTVTGNNKRDLLKESTFFVLLTTYAKEGQPISILEAAVNGLIVISTDHAGIPELTDDYLVKLVVKSDEIDVDNCFAYLNDLPRTQMAEGQLANRKLTLGRYGQAQYITNLVSVFRNVT